MSDQESSRRIAVITGAGSGIGASICQRLAAPGMCLVLHTRENRENIEAVAKEAQEAGAETEIVYGDLIEEETAAKVIDAAHQRFGGLDHLVSNAGFPDRSPIGELKTETLLLSVQAMAGAFMRLSTAALPHLEKSEHGRVVAVTGLAAHSFKLGGLRFPATSAAKAAVEALAKGLAAQLSPVGVTVNCVVPGFIRTHSGLYGDDDSHGRRYAAQIVPLSRLGQPEEVAAAVTFLLSDDAGYITGQLLHVNGGLDL